jgi:isopentenyl diphosphate isomerase/L-lactate dehydrogenase-like FMN-dependent dehydrogenase
MRGSINRVMPAPVNLADYEALARERLPRDVFDYYSGGAWDLATVHENQEAYARLRIHYHVMRDVSVRDTTCEIFGLRASLPVFVAPTAFHRLAHLEGEVATAQGAAAAGTIMTLSSLSTRLLEDVAAASPGPLWFQLYMNRDRDFTRELAGRAAAAGYKAIVVTADTPVWGIREVDVRNGFHLPPGVEAVNLLPSHSQGGQLSHQGKGMAEIMSWMLNPALTWQDIAWLAGATPLPVLVKGVCRADDARQAVDHGASGLIVSNHGGRQLDGAPATIDVLPEVVAAVGSRVPVLVDGGVRRGADVLKALARGARAVLVGRPILWGLASGGAEGVTGVLHKLHHELDTAMALAGCASLSDIDPDLVRPAC